MKQIKKDFVLAIALSDSHRSAFQRANVYSKGASESDRKEFLKAFKQKLRLLEMEYSKKVEEDAHIDNIKRFKKELSDKFPHVLKDSLPMRFGVAQKAVNLYLKYLWVLDYIPQPPHCPVDRIVLNEVGINDINWTQLDSEEVYKSIIERISEVAKPRAIAEWELKFFNKFNKNDSLVAQQGVLAE